MKKYRKRRHYNRHVDLRYKIIWGMLLLVIGVLLLTFSFKNELFVTEWINNIFYYPFHNLVNNDDLIGQNINDELQREIDDLKKLTNIKNVLTDFEVINSVVIARNLSYWDDEIVINRGRENGVEKGMAVVVSEGLVGYISEVYTTSARVKLLASPLYNNTSVRVNDLYLVLEFDKDHNLIINQLDNRDVIKEGDIVYTSGLTEKFPAGLTIGRISKIEENTYESGKKLYVSLDYDVNSLRYVSVLKRSAQ